MPKDFVGRRWLEFQHYCVDGLFNDKVETITVKDSLSSLKLLIENHIEYEAYPALFCFGLLKQFDVDEIIALCSPIKVNSN
jgi:hypothetical protein